MNLKDLIKQVLDNHDLAEELLPTQSGFFFGSTEYNECYFNDLKETYDMLCKLKKEDFENYDYEYYAWW